MHAASEQGDHCWCDAAWWCCACQDYRRNKAGSAAPNSRHLRLIDRIIPSFRDALEQVCQTPPPSPASSPSGGADGPSCCLLAGWHLSSSWWSCGPVTTAGVRQAARGARFRPAQRGREGHRREEEEIPAVRRPPPPASCLGGPAVTTAPQPTLPGHSSHLVSLLCVSWQQQAPSPGGVCPTAARLLPRPPGALRRPHSHRKGLRRMGACVGRQVEGMMAHRRRRRLLGPTAVAKQEGQELLPWLTRSSGE